MEPRGIEPVTSCVQGASWSTLSPDSSCPCGLLASSGVLSHVPYGSGPLPRVLPPRLVPERRPTERRELRLVNFGREACWPERCAAEARADGGRSVSGSETAPTSSMSAALIGNS
jgi:hypothetical protein